MANVVIVEAAVTTSHISPIGASTYGPAPWVKLSSISVVPILSPGGTFAGTGTTTGQLFPVGNR